MTSQSHSRRRKPECPVEDVFIFSEQELEIAGRISADRTEVFHLRVYFREVDVTHTFSTDELEDFEAHLLAEYTEPKIDEMSLAKAQRERELETIA